MDYTYSKVLLGCIFIGLLIFGMITLLPRWKHWLEKFKYSKRQLKQLDIVDYKQLDLKRRVVVLAYDKKKYLILLGMQNESVIDITEKEESEYNE